MGRNEGKSGKRRRGEGGRGRMPGVTRFHRPDEADEALMRVQQELFDLGGVMQEANVAFQINNDQLTFSDPPNPGIDFYGLVIGDTIDVGEPSDGSVNPIKLNQGATFTMGGLEVNGDVNLDSTTLVIDKINHRVGLGTANPTTRLHVSAGDIYLDADRYIDFGLGATRSNIKGSNNLLVLRGQNNNLGGSIQCGKRKFKIGRASCRERV